MVTVKVMHHCKAWRKGDLEDDLVLLESENFRTFSSAKEYVEKQVKGKKIVHRDYHKSTEKSYVTWFTGVTWQHENSGAVMEEYYQYIIEPTKVRE